MANGNPFYVEPALSVAAPGIGQAIQTGSQYLQQEAQAAKRQQVLQGAADVFKSGDPDAIAAYSFANPEVAGLINQQLGVRDEAARKENSAWLSDMLTSNPLQREQKYQQRIAKLKSEGRGRDTTHTEQSFADYRENPEGELKEMEALYAGLDPQGYKAFSAGREKPMTEFQREKLSLDKESQNIRREETEIRKLEQQEKKETNKLKKEKLQADIDAKKQKTEQTKIDFKQGIQDGISKIDSSIDTIDRALTHPGLESAVGFGANFPTISGSAAADFEAILETVQSQQFLTAVKEMRGMGALSENEGKKLAASAGSLSLDMSDKQMKSELDRIQASLRKAKRKMEGRLPREEATQQNQQFTEGQTATNPNTGAKMVYRGGQWQTL